MAKPHGVGNARVREPHRFREIDGPSLAVVYRAYTFVYDAKIGYRPHPPHLNYTTPGPRGCSSAISRQPEAESLPPRFPR